MKSGTLYWNISFVIQNLLTFALVIGLQNHFLYTITKTVTVVAVALPQTQAVVGSTAALVESLQFNAFDTTHSTFASSPSSSSSWSSSYLPSSSSSFEGAGGAIQQKFSSPSLASSVAYPTSSTTMSGFHNTKTSRIMSNINSISPTQTINLILTTFRTRGNSRNSGNTSGDSSGVSLSTMLLGKQQNTLSSYAPTTSISHGSGLSFKNVKKSKSKNTITASDTSRSQGSSSFYNNDQQEQQNQQQHFPLDFTFSKNHWTNSDAALNGGVDAGIVGTNSGASGVVGNFRLASLSSVTSSSSSSITAFSSSSSSSATETERPRIFRNKHHHERHWGPFFEEPLNSTTSGDNSITTAHLYTEAVLNCRVGMLKDKTVMWVRRTSEKVSLLTVGNVTYSSDPRIRVKFQYPNNWRLLINPTQWDDAGIYMCQVSTHPPRVFTTNLTVIEPPLRLIDDQERDVGDRYYKTGSTIDLQCQVSRSFLYKEKQNILKSLKPLNVHNDSNTTSSSSTTTTSSSSFRGTSSSSGIGSNTLNPGYSNNNSNNKNQTKMIANKNNKHVSPATNINGITSPSSSATTTTTGFGVFNNDLLQNINQSTTSADKQGIALEQQFSNLVFWSKDDEELPPTALKRISSNDKWLTSRVTITDAKLTDSGNYSCSIGRLFTAIVQVQVLTGELPAAVQHNSAAAVVVCNISIRELIQLYWIYVTAAYFIMN
ncbi:serine-rich adhesin for platelets [Lucilia cuprina]|uniref:serine-rich adhesin for platelets n=1 Tax=Lucilia cuprina TaxID=7375 RepID=UPI001F0686C0|nr:serine-rich adhesin for platelets [Lucilia cuprina]XP_046801605.1 serine-rich adhesin for platelets [Lucilia cuprina]XP_046801606.1 serine-rich adhesin for platelets [Lucilia cuprina]XP_046801607.1 serine-rich adhesin for platelets [Lucilia cuprina]